MRTISLFLLLLLWTPMASAATFCVETATELQNALDTAASNGESDIIRVAVGTYEAPAGGFALNAQTLTDFDQDIVIRGGFSEFFGNPCGNEGFFQTTDTVLSSDSGNILSIELPGAGDITVLNLSFVGAEAQSSGGGLRVTRSAGTYSGKLRIENNAFIANRSNSLGGGLYIGKGGSNDPIEGTSSTAILVVNNLFSGNVGGSCCGALYAFVDAPPPPPPVLSTLPALVVAHNTVSNNSAQVGGSYRAISLRGDIQNTWVVSNNIWGLDATADIQLVLLQSETIVVRNNNIQDINVGSINVADVYLDNIRVTPQYVSCGVGCFDLVPVTGSPLTNAGWAPAGGLPFFSPAWQPPEFDLTGTDRVKDGRIDIGAYEGIADTMFADRFEN